MHKSATLKLTAWYLLILMSISLLFSIIIYRVADSEINTRLDIIQQRLQREPDIIPLTGTDIRSMSLTQAHQAAFNLFITLFYINVMVLASGGIGSYLLARRTLGPIERAYEAQSRFTSDASHELRTPLAAMKTELEVALRDPELSKNDMRLLLNSNLEEVNKLTQLSHMLLQLSRLESPDLTSERIDLVEITKNVAWKYDKSGSRIKLNLPLKPLMMAGNSVSIEELVMILIDNAIKYSPSDSQVEVTVTKKSKQALIEIKNSGEGINPDDLPHIFDRFYRSDSSRTDSSKNGYGLGLSLAKRIVTLHHGELSASSAKRQLTTFNVMLPLQAKHVTGSDKKSELK